MAGHGCTRRSGAVSGAELRRRHSGRLWVTPGAKPVLGPSTPVLIDGVRTPFGRRGGALSAWKPVGLLRHVIEALLTRTGISPSMVDQIVGGCVTQVGDQGLNVTRNAWLATGHDPSPGCTTIDASCGSGQQAAHLAAALIAAGAAQVTIACGVESMSRAPAGSNVPAGIASLKLDDHPWDDPRGVQFGGAERVADLAQLGRRELDCYGVLSQTRAAVATEQGRFRAEMVPVAGLTVDEGLRPAALDLLSRLPPVLRGGRHTAATSSQVSDGASAMLWTSYRMAQLLRLQPLAWLRAQVLRGSPPAELLTGPLVATAPCLRKAGVRIEDLDIVEINEAFASVPLAWCREYGRSPEEINVDGGAIALGHPLGATGGRLLMHAARQLHRTDGELALVSVCCGGAMGAATVLQRL
ncbi:acetyl-CoA C-acyltransferase [Kribbella sp. NPDC050820]|uniref:acetyl-CoA C-acyltransferase n=1 Tax=Kribbella sp. NPDC050820 TaxID=3155408 RepID=UPI0033F7A436